VNRTIEKNGTSWLEKNSGGWNWTRVAPIDSRVSGNQLQLAIPRKGLASLASTTKPKDKVSIDFKWADNLQVLGDPMDFYTSGDVAPDARFKYRYSAD
jgi:hypothetical protein